MLKKIKQLAEIYLAFLKLGSMSFGGGYAMLSLIEREIVEEKQWVDKEKIVDIFAVAESLPGAIALNSSAFAGFYIAGIPGALTALVGNLTSPILIVLALSLAYEHLKDSPVAVSAFTGIYPAIVGLILYAAYKIGKTAIKDSAGLLLALGAFLLSIFSGQPPIPLIVAGALTGISLKDIFSGLKDPGRLRLAKGFVGIILTVALFTISCIFGLATSIVTSLLFVLLISSVAASLIPIPGSASNNGGSDNVRTS